MKEKKINNSDLKKIEELRKDVDALSELVERLINVAQKHSEAINNIYNIFKKKYE